MCCGRWSGKGNDLLLFTVKVAWSSSGHQGCGFFTLLGLFVGGLVWWRVGVQEWGVIRGFFHVLLSG